MTALTAAERVEVMLSVLPWLEANGGAELTELAERFDCDPDQLREDLLMVFTDVEPEEGPDHMVEVDLEDDFVTVRLPDYFRQPLQVSLTEALTLLAAGQSRLDAHGNRPELATAVNKLAAAIGENALDAVSVDLGPTDPGLMAVLREATAQRQRIEIDYYSHGSNTTSTRTVEPHRLSGLEGKWYLSAYCTKEQDRRQFRVDRVLRATLVGEPGEFEAPDGGDSRGGDSLLESMGSGGRVVEMTVPTELMWMLLDLRGLRIISTDDESVHASVAAHGEAWLDRLLLRLGSEATVVDTDGRNLATRRAEVAGRILERYA